MTVASDLVLQATKVAGSVSGAASSVRGLFLSGPAKEQPSRVTVTPLQRSVVQAVPFALATTGVGETPELGAIGIRLAVENAQAVAQDVWKVFRKA